MSLHIHPLLETFVHETLLPESGISETQFWQELSSLIETFSPENQALLKTRDKLQQEIDNWHKNNPDGNKNSYKQFLTDIGYLEPISEGCTINTANVDPEIASIAGPQLVVPVDNARYAINAVNARWGSLYDACYGTDMVANTGDTAAGKQFNPARGEAVFQLAHQFLDAAVPLASASYADVTNFSMTEEHHGQMMLTAHTKNTSTFLANSAQFVGFKKTDCLEALVLQNNGLHIVLHLDPDHPIGRLHPAHIKDVELESALSTILDLEDSVATVDAEDKVRAYGNLLGLMQGSLTTEMKKNGKAFTRSLNADKTFSATDGSALTLAGRSMMLARNVGHHMLTDMVKTADGQEVYEGIVDAAISAVIAKQTTANSRTGSFYIVKPKMHGSAEVAFAVKLFADVEQAFGLAANTLKIGIMDEERRTTVNLKACIAAAKERVIFINTGFLDRTGDEIHTSMQAGPVLPKDAIKQQPWLFAYEDANVKAGLDCGFSGHAQIGKGMWAVPDNMQQMVASKIVHPQAGANCAWVPSPTAATLHAMHYHQVDVLALQKSLDLSPDLDDILTIPLLTDRLSQPEIEQELDNNIQGILGYVVRWVDAGVGCSKVPDIHDVGLMEDRATLRISSQHVGNWLHHGVCDKEQVEATFLRMAKVVDAQNANTPGYRALLENLEGAAMQAAKALVYEAVAQPNGYTEFILTKYRRQAKTYMQ